MSFHTQLPLLFITWHLFLKKILGTQLLKCSFWQFSLDFTTCFIVASHIYTALTSHLPRVVSSCHKTVYPMHLICFGILGTNLIMINQSPVLSYLSSSSEWIILIKYDLSIFFSNSNDWPREIKIIFSCSTCHNLLRYLSKRASAGKKKFYTHIIAEISWLFASQKSSAWNIYAKMEILRIKWI